MGSPGAAPTQIRMLLTIEVSGEPQRVAKYVELLREEAQATISFIDAMFESAEPTMPKRCHAVIHEAKAEIQ